MRVLKKIYQELIEIKKELRAIRGKSEVQIRTDINSQAINQRARNRRVGLSEDGKYATYELKFVQEIMHYLKDVDTDKSKELLRRMICPNPRKSDMSEEESRLRSMTRAERKAMLYGASLPRDSEILKILRRIEGGSKLKKWREVSI